MSKKPNRISLRPPDASDGRPHPRSRPKSGGGHRTPDLPSGLKNIPSQKALSTRAVLAQARGKRSLFLGSIDHGGWTGHRILKGEDPEIRYRPHIDGLRTVAIVPVVLFHVDVALVSGGFTGVDVFFVISGFLITSLIIEEIAEDRFTIWNFYKRRFLRILPAYLAMIAVVIAVSWSTLFPEETRALGQSIVAAALFVSNVHFWASTDYFAPDIAMAPLLHTWTLAVEEQYYILLPVFLLLVTRVLGRRYVAAILVVSALSFLLSVWGATRYDVATFYLLPTRAWEFGMGALAAVAGLTNRGSVQGRNLGAALGAGLVAWGIFGLDRDAVFPGANAIYPVMGAVLLLCCAEGTPAGRLLGSRPFVAIGRISYSLYLWHWPIVVFWKLRIDPALDAGDVAAICALSLVAAWLSHAFVEEPFRGRGMRARPSLIVNVVALGSLLLAAGLGSGLVAGAERWSGHSAEARRIARYVDYRTDLEVHPCLIHARVPGREAAFDPAACLPEDPGRPTLLLVGDSHAEHLMPAFETALPDFNLQFAASTGCAPTVDLTGDGYCPRVLGPVLRDHVPAGGVDVVVLSNRWEPGDVEPLQRTVDFLADHVGKVVILGPTPEYLGSFPAILARNLDRTDDRLRRFLDPAIRQLDRRMAATDWGSALYVSLYDLICPGECRLLTQGGVPYLADYGHYTRAAAREIAADLEAAGTITPD